MGGVEWTVVEWMMGCLAGWGMCVGCAERGLACPSRPCPCLAWVEEKVNEGRVVLVLPRGGDG